MMRKWTWKGDYRPLLLMLAGLVVGTFAFIKFGDAVDAMEARDARIKDYEQRLMNIGRCVELTRTAIGCVQ